MAGVWKVATAMAGLLVGALVLAPVTAMAGGTAQTSGLKVLVNGKSVQTDGIVLEQDRAYLPLRAMAEVLGKNVSWDAATRTVNIEDGIVEVGRYELQHPQDLGSNIPLAGFSGLVHIPGDPPNILYTNTDRGPNGEAGADKRRTFPLPDFAPSILKIELNAGEIKVLERIPLKRPDGQLISGRPPLKGYDEVPYDVTGEKELSYDPNGVDLEGIAYNPYDDTFWLSDEYSPSVIHVKRDGTVIERLVPQGLSAQLGVDYAKDVFPAYFTKRVQNRGFEGVAVTPDGRYLFAVIQSPLRNPDAKASAASRVMRIVEVDLQSMKQVGEFLYVADSAKGIDGLKQKDVAISDLFAINKNELIVDERDKNDGDAARIKRLYKIDLHGATNVMGKESVDGTGLEAMSPEGLQTSGIVAAPKQLLVDILAATDFRYEKVEGVAMIDSQTLAFTNDNDFGIDYKGTDMILTGVPTQVRLLKLPTPLY